MVEVIFSQISGSLPRPVFGQLGPPPPPPGGVLFVIKNENKGTKGGGEEKKRGWRGFL